MDKLGDQNMERTNRIMEPAQSERHGAHQRQEHDGEARASGDARHGGDGRGCEAERDISRGA